MDIELPPDKPGQILAFASKDGERQTIEVDLDSPFFTVKTPRYPECDHRNRGVTLETASRRVYCLCGAEVDAFDALQIYANAERRLQSTRRAIEDHAKKEQEKKDRIPFSRDVVGYVSRPEFGFDLKLECGHALYWHRRKAPRRAQCETCIRIDRLKKSGMGVVDGTKPWNAALNTSSERL